MPQTPTPPPTYITTPIYYVNDRPHIGHCYTTLLADYLARFHRMVRGLPTAGGPGSSGQVFMLTGTDEHAEKVVTTAASHGLSPIQWADQNAAAFQQVFTELGYTFDDFIRTTQERHKTRVSGYLRKLLEKGDIARGEFEGWYDVNEEAYVTETKAKEQNYVSAVTGRPLVRRKEPNYYFKLSKYQAWLEQSISNGTIRVEPEARRNEVLGRLREGLQDVPITRPVTDDPATQFGIRMPGDEGHRIYVWIDALFNYLTAVDTPERRHLWPPTVHLMGKEILWFHAVIWPAMLHALGEPLPRMIYAHSHYTRDGKKMSKTLGNFIDLETIRAYAAWAPNKDKLPVTVDALRWYLLTQGPLSATDADFSHAKFVEVYNADLANGIGNCASRVGNMIDKYFGGVMPDHMGRLTHEVTEKATETGEVHHVFDWPKFIEASVRDTIAAVEQCDIARALGHAVDLVRQVDIYINATRPFSLAKLVDKGEASREGLGQILYHCAEAVRVASLLMAPAIPAKMEALWRTWSCAPPAGVPLTELARFAGPHALKPGQAITKGEILFMRADGAVPPPA
ncbi:MAG TPA: methionine--tRNA ligase [Phycisphaerales bacterium]|nr:methionine--tRNA ligase [Phycisphaerales bacterium]